MTTPRPRPAKRPTLRPVAASKTPPGVSVNHKRSHGTAGGSAAGIGGGGQSSYTVGAAGERETAAQIDRLLEADPHLYAFHDLGLRDGTRANIDHLLIRGSQVLLLDTKKYTPGTYWTMPGGATHRGWFREVPSLDRQGVQLLQRKIREALGRLGLPASNVTSALVMRPAGPGLISCRFLRPNDGVKAVAYPDLPRLVRSALGTGSTTDHGALLAWAGSLPRKS